MSAGYDETVPLRQHLITQRLRQRRVELGLTQKQVVERLSRHGLRTANRTLSSIEHGAGLEVAKLPAIALALECSVTYLVGLTDDPRQWQPDVPAEAPATKRRVVAAAEPALGSLILGGDVPDRAPQFNRLGATHRP
ncbi:MAG: helix-turn-helix transcriptional regulator [Pseudonocardiales bacterium]